MYQAQKMNRMKTDRYNLFFISAILMIQGTVRIFAQTSTENYIKARTVQVEGIKTEAQLNALTSPSDVSTQITYYDGLGRPKQVVNRKASPGNYDIRQSIYYDEFGREARQYLPYRYNNNGSYDPNWVANQESFYGPSSTVVNDASPWGYTVYDNSPLNRVTKQFGPRMRPLA